MSIKTKSFLVVVLTIGFLVLGQTFAQAQETTASQGNSAPTVMAKVNISGARIVSQNANVFKLSFDLINDANVQPQVIYGVMLLKDQTIVNQKVFNDDMLSLGAGEKINKEITYTAPAFLNGDYLLVIEARNSEGFIFRQMPISNVTLKSSGSSILIKDDSCKLYTANDPSTTATPDQGIHINQGDVLKMSCDLENDFNTPKNVVPVITTRYHSVFGKEVSEQKLTSFGLSANEKVTKEFEIPLNNQPQFYSGVFKLTDENGNVISNEIYLFYLVRGDGGMIQNVILDKDAYKVGENANIQVWYNVSVQNGTMFAISNFIDGGKIYITIKDEKGEVCSDQFFQEQKVDQTNNYSVPITKDCVGPAAEVVIKDKDGKTLMQNSFAVQIKDGKVPLTVVISLIIALIILIVLLGFLFLKRKKNTQEINM